MKKPIIKPSNPFFSCGPTRKPSGWNLKIINDSFLGRYHRSRDVLEYVESILEKTKKILEIPKDYKIFIVPGSCTGAMDAVFWSILGPRKITSIVYDEWGCSWNKEIEKLNVDIDCRKSMNGVPPNLKNISRTNDIVLVWTGTTFGMTISDINFIPKDHSGLVIADITSAAFICHLPWKKIDISVFSWQKALGSESQHGMIVLSPKAFKRLKKVRRLIPKILDIRKFKDFINTPSLLSLSDFSLCLDLYEKRGGLMGNNKICIENKLIIENWVKKNKYLSYFVKDENYRALTPTYLIFRSKFNYDKLFNYLIKERVAFDIKNYRGTKPGLRIWTGPTIKKKDLISLTNWLDWTFYKYAK